MIKNQKINKEKAILVGVYQLKNSNDTFVDRNLDELELLAKTAGAKVVGRVTQKISKINSATYIGKGKAKHLIGQAVELDAKLILFDDELTPAQIKNYHKMSDKIKILDRSGLILDIFLKRARTKEASTQVNLAYFEYLLPRLTRQWTHLERQMGGIGTRAGMGETQIEIDRRLIRNRITKLKKELNCIEDARQVQSSRRISEFRVSLVGYTNAGKSTLFNALTGTDVYVEDELFATLDTTVRKLNIDVSHEILISDTVGFINKLPHNLVASFKSTLKEVIEADLIIIVLDMSSENISGHLNVINNVLSEIGADGIPHIIALNKVDLLSSSNQIDKIQYSFPGSLIISARQHLMLSRLKNRIIEHMEKNYQTIELKFSYNEGRIIANAQKGVEVLERNYSDEKVKLKIRGSKPRISQILSELN